MTAELSIPRPDDWHVHFREGELLPLTLAASGRCFGRCVAMPNLQQPLTTAAAIKHYQAEISQYLPKFKQLQLLFTLFLTEDSEPQELDKAVNLENFFAVKYYPRGATTNSSAGVGNPAKCHKFFDRMQKLNIPLLIHAESAAVGLDVFEREAKFIDEELQTIRQDFPALKITLEHISSKAAADYLRASSANTAATITPQHLAYNRNHLLDGKLKPHLFCKPILKREEDRQALLQLIKDKFPRVFLGSDSAPHPRSQKEASCGCAGVFSAPHLIELVTEILDELGALEALAAFTALNGANYYDFPVAETTLTLVRQQTEPVPPLEYAAGAQLVPLGVGRALSWSVR